MSNQITLADKRLHVGLFIGNMTGGGAERAVLEILEKFDRNRFRFSLILLKTSGDYMKSLPGDVDVIGLYSRCGISNYRMLKIARGLAAVVEELELDVLHSSLTHINLIALQAKWLFRFDTPVIVTEQNSLEPKFASKPWFKRIVYQYYLKFFYQKSQGISACSAGVMANVKQRLGSLDTVKSKRIIFNSVNESRVKEGVRGEAKLLQHKDVGERPRQIVAMGRLTKQKGFSFLINCFANVAKSLDCRLYILGKGELEAKLVKQISDLGIEGKVVLPGFVDNPWAEIKNADLFVLSSLWEGLPNVLIEAMAVGVPVIATRCNYGPEEIITDTVDGILVPVLDVQEMEAAILRVLNNNQLSERLAQNAVNVLNDFGSAKVVSNYMEWYSEIAKNKKY